MRPMEVFWAGSALLCGHFFSGGKRGLAVRISINMGSFQTVFAVAIDGRGFIFIWCSFYLPSLLWASLSTPPQRESVSCNSFTSDLLLLY